jgi:hypothetical protein
MLKEENRKEHVKEAYIYIYIKGKKQKILFKKQRERTAQEQ